MKIHQRNVLAITLLNSESKSLDKPHPPSAGSSHCAQSQHSAVESAGFPVARAPTDEGMPPFVHHDPTGLVRGLFGGVIIALSTTAMMALTGQMGGVSGILGGFPRGLGAVLRWRFAFLAGLLVAGGILTALPAEETTGPPLGLHWAAAVIGGVSTGFGTRLANGCTSGHGIIGLARLSPRSLVAVLTFMGVAVVTAGVSRAPFAREALYGPVAALSLPFPLSVAEGADWTLPPSLYVVPLAAAVAFVLLCHASLAVFKGARSTREGGKAGSPAAVTDSSSSGAVLSALVVDVDATPLPGSDVESAPLKLAPVSPPSFSSPPTTSTTSLPWTTLALAQAAVFACGLAFGVGLAVSGMTSPHKVLRFLDFAGDGGWDPQLMLVMGGGVAVNAVLWRAMAVGGWAGYVPPLAGAVSDSGPCGTDATAPLGKRIAYGPAAKANRVVDAKLLVGSVLFGFGWGLTGVCPGPGIVDYVTGGAHFGVTLPAIVAGMAAYEVADALRLL